MRIPQESVHFLCNMCVHVLQVQQELKRREAEDQRQREEREEKEKRKKEKMRQVSRTLLILCVAV